MTNYTIAQTIELNKGATFRVVVEDMNQVQEAARSIVEGQKDSYEFIEIFFYSVGADVENDPAANRIMWNSAEGFRQQNRQTGDYISF